MSSGVALAMLALAGCGGDGADPTPAIVVGALSDVDGPGGEMMSEDPPPVEPPVQPLTVTRRAALNLRFPPDRNEGELASNWLAVIDVFQIESRPATTGDIYVDLLRYDSPRTFSSHADFYGERLETCEVRDLDAEGGDDEPDRGKRSVSGGDELTLFSAGGRWVGVPFSNTDVVYDGDDVFPGPVPSDLTLSLPGAEFPPIDMLPLARFEAPVRLSPAIDEIVTPETEFRWEPGDGTRMRAVFVSFLDGEFQGFPIVCYIGDDGEFIPSDAALEEIRLRPGQLTVRYVRESRWLDYRDGVVLFQNVSIADD